MNEEGSFYIGTTVFDLRTGEQFAIPLEADNEPGSVTNQVFNSVVIKSTFALGDGGSMFFGNDTNIYFDPGTTFNTTTGPITAGQSPLPEVYATTAKAGLVQLADNAVIRGALGSGSRGIADKVVVTAESLATELNVRFENSLAEGTGVSIGETSIELPGGDPADSSDNITQFLVSIGLPGNSDDVAFAGLRLGDASTGQLVTSIVNSTTGISKNSASDSKLITEKALVDYMKAQPLVVVIPTGPDGGGSGPSGWEHIGDYIVNKVADATLYPVGQVLKLVRRALNYTYTAPSLSYGTGSYISISFVNSINFNAGSFSADFYTSYDDVVWTYVNDGTRFVLQGARVAP
jgi:hypothetical protein